MMGNQPRTGQRAKEINGIIILLINMLSAGAFVFPALHIFFQNSMVLIVFFSLAIFLFINPSKFNSMGKEFLLFTVTFILSLLSVTFTSGGLGSWLIITNFAMMYVVSMRISISNKAIKWSALLYCGVIFVWLFRTGLMTYNPNTIGMLSLVSILCGDLYFCARFENLRNKQNPLRYAILVLVIYAAITAQIKLSESRGALYCGILFLVIRYIFPVSILKKKPIFYGLMYFLTLGPILWSRLMVYMYTHGINIDLPLTNKNFYTGREWFWSEAWSSLESQWTFGLGTRYQTNATFSVDVHNAMFGILTIYGSLVFVTVLLLVFRNWSNIYKNIYMRKGDVSYSAFCGLVTLMVYSFNEGVMVTSSFVTPIILLFLTISNNASDEKTSEESIVVSSLVRNKPRRI